MNHENCLGPCCISWSKRLSAAVASAGVFRQVSIAADPITPLCMASSTPDEKTGSMKA